MGSRKILRFRASERLVHWSIAIPFLVCYTTALVLVVVYNPDPLRPYREVFSWTHRISGVCLIVFPLLAVARSTGDFRVHLSNIRQAWSWVLDDLKWLALMGLAVLSRRIQLPPQGKFNAAQKLNFMLVMTTYPLYIATGLLMWLTGAALLAWLIHVFMALVATPFLLGHIFMATIPRSSRKAFQGMVSRLVDREWAKHHHRRWYDETFDGRRKGVERREVVMPKEKVRTAAADATTSTEPGPKELERHAKDGRTGADSPHAEQVRRLKDLPRDAKGRTVFRVSRDRDGNLDWRTAQIDERDAERRRQVADQILRELRRRDPGGDTDL